MKRAILCVSTLVTVCALGVISTAGAADTSLKAGFETPPHAAKPQVWWHWIDGNVSEDGAELDFEWMEKILSLIHI